MDMKKILQAFDSTSDKVSEASSTDMKKILQIMEGKGNRLTSSESIVLNHYSKTEQVTQPSSNINKYFKQVETELTESSNKELVQKIKRTQQLAERAIKEVGGNYGHPSNLKKHISQSKRPSDNIVNMAKSGARVDNKRRKSQQEGINPEDNVSLNIPLLMRVMEYAKEDAKTDMDLHHVVEKMIELSSKGKTLTMDQYDDIVGDQTPSNETYESLKTDNPCWKNYKPVGTKKKNGKTVPNCVPK